MSAGAAFFLSIFLIIYLTFTFGLYKMFEKAGEAGWKAIIPVYNWVVWLKLIGKPLWWTVLILIPVVGVLVLVAMVIELARAYGKYDLKDHAAALILPFYFFPRTGLDPKAQYLGPPEKHENLPKKSSLREWGDAILFAGVAALIIRTFFIEAFMIPTSSMERTLMAGDFLFVSKFHYGSRMPMNPLSVPFVHNKIKIGNFTAPSYLDWIKLPYYRTPGVEKVERNDIVVFNYPAHDIHDLGDGAGMVKPVSMKENYIKRCVGMPGDTFRIVNQQVHINGEVGKNPDLMQYQYQVEMQGTSGFSNKRLNKLGFRRENSDNPNWGRVAKGVYHFFMPNEVVTKIEEFPGVAKVDTVYRKAGSFRSGIYPRHNNKTGQIFPWNEDNFGPMYIPKAGTTVPLTPGNISLYFRPITAYEGHELEMKDGKAYVDGKLAESYTFEQDYYFMMGDNRHNSEDSRFWGFVPEDHIVGRPLFVFFSYEKDFGIRGNRIGTKYVH
ncbi:MAG: signal peptidase I [Bacteroidota bacterium]